MWRIVVVGVVLGLSGFAMAAEKVPVILDTSIGTGASEPLALGVLLASPELDVRGITTTGANPADRAMIVCRFLTSVGRGDIPVAAGAGEQPIMPIDWQIQYRRHPAVVWDRTVKPVKMSADAFIAEKVKAEPGKITIIATGSLTNFARAMERDPALKVKRLITTANAVQVDRAATLRVRDLNLAGVVTPAAGDVAADDLRDVFAAHTPLTFQVQALVELSEGKPTLDSAAAVMSATSNANYATVVKAYGEPALPKPPPNEVPLVELGMFPNRVHVFEDYETDIERQWWLAGKIETKDVPDGSKRAMRATLTQDFDDRMGDASATYRAVVFNPVPGPPMGKNTRLTFHYKLTGTDALRVQIFTLSKGYHRCLSLKGLPQGEWRRATVDMTQARRPDGSGGPLSEDERIDDIQFYIDPRGGLLIDDIVLHDAAAEGETRPFPKRILFTGWFDTGKQGAEWPGEFEIVAHEKPLTWKFAQSRGAALNVGLRGQRGPAKSPHVSMRYSIAADTEATVAFGALRKQLSLKGGEGWRPITVVLDGEGAAGKLELTSKGNAPLRIDDVLIYEP